MKIVTRIVNGQIVKIEAPQAERQFDGTLDPAKLMVFERPNGKLAIWHPDYQHTQYGKTLFVGSADDAQVIVDKVYAAWTAAQH
jgi:hypothetical protein